MFVYRFVRVATLGALLVGAALCSAQSQPSLEILSPLDGAMTNPGQIVTVSVSSPSGDSFAQVGVLAEDPLNVDGVATSLPAQFSLTIPSGLALRSYALTAMGVTAAGTSVESQSLNIDVERPDMPLAISPQFTTITMEAQGQTSAMMLLATFADGSVLDVTESSNVSYQSSNPSIATVDQFGTATAVAPGSTSITITYTNPTGGANLQRSVPVTVLPPLLTLTPPSLSFGNVNIGGSASLPLTVTNTTPSDNSLTIKGITVTGNYSETDNCLSLPSLPVGSSCQITVTFAPIAPGASTGALSVTYSSSSVLPVIPMTGTGVAVPPVITGILPIPEGPIGTPITIAGNNFGPVQGNSTVVIGGVTATPTSWSNTSIGLNVPATLPVGVFDVAVTANGLTSNVTTLDVAPAITGLSPSFGPVGTPVTITGTSFGATQGTSTVSFCGQQQPTSWNDTAIVVTVPDDPSGICTPTVSVSFWNGESSLSNRQTLFFDISPPSITGISPSSGLDPTTVTVSGSNFGINAGAVTFNGVAGTVWSWAPTMISVDTPAGVTSGPVVVTTSHGESATGGPFTVIVPPRTFVPSSASSTTPGLLQLATTHSAVTSFASQDLINQPPGEYEIEAFDTQAGIPNSSNTWPAGSSAGFSFTMQQLAGTAGTLFPEAKLFLNGPSGTPICTAIASTALSSTQATYNLSCAPNNAITLVPTDRYYLWVGVNSTTASSVSLQFQLTVGLIGRGFGDYSTVTVPIQ